MTHNDQTCAVTFISELQPDVDQLGQLGSFAPKFRQSFRSRNLSRIVPSRNLDEGEKIAAANGVHLLNLHFGTNMIQSFGLDW
jgi:hypothetical protein